VIHWGLSDWGIGDQLRDRLIGDCVTRDLATALEPGRLGPTNHPINQSPDHQSQSLNSRIPQ
jgi:hypothetical protein